MTNPTGKPAYYCSYILRCWEEPNLTDGKEEKRSRFSLEDPHTGERRGFANIRALAEFLQSNVEQVIGQGTTGTTPAQGEPGTAS
jgi:hypothetical protein